MAVSVIPDGWWTGYADLRELVDHGSFQTVGSWMSRDDAPRKAYRVLQSTGTISPGFVWNRANTDRTKRGQTPQQFSKAKAYALMRGAAPIRPND